MSEESEPKSEPKSETLYIQNLNEKVKVDVLKSSLRALFKSYGEVLDVVAHHNLRMRGQAFVSFASPEIAAAVPAPEPVPAAVSVTLGATVA